MATRSPPAFPTIYRSAPREDALSFTAALSQDLTVRCAAPQTIKRSRALTVRAESLPRDSSRRQNYVTITEGNSVTSRQNRTDPTIFGSAIGTNVTVDINGAQCNMHHGGIHTNSHVPSKFSARSSVEYAIRSTAVASDKV